MLVGGRGNNGYRGVPTPGQPRIKVDLAQWSTHVLHSSMSQPLGSPPGRCVKLVLRITEEKVFRALRYRGQRPRLPLREKQQQQQQENVVAKEKERHAIQSSCDI